MTLRPGMVLHIGEACSVQFAGTRALRLRLVSVDDKPTYAGWVWLTGYVLDARGDATAKRELYVQREGVRVLSASAAVAGPRVRRLPPARVAAGR